MIFFYSVSFTKNGVFPIEKSLTVQTTVLAMTLLDRTENSYKNSLERTHTTAGKNIHPETQCDFRNNRGSRHNIVHRQTQKNVVSK